MFWGGGYDPLTDEIAQGPFVVAVPRAVEVQAPARGDLRRSTCR